MIRYLALAWNDAIAPQAAAASQLSLAMRASGTWCSALVAPGLHVFFQGSRGDVNQDYPLGDGSGVGSGVVLGKLFRRRDLGVPSAAPVALTGDEAQRVVHSGGNSLIREFWGRYVAFMRSPGGSVRILRDPSGTLPCYLIQHQGVCIAFSWLEDVLAELPAVPPPGIHWTGLAGQLLYGELGGRETALDTVSQVVPGQAVDLCGPQERACLLWNAVDHAGTVSQEPLDLTAQRLRQTVHDCAQAWAGAYDHILFRLSGGVDSSILLSALARGSTPAEVLCVNYHSPGSDSDERRYARQAAERAKRELVERERDPTFRLESVLTVARTPTPGNYVGRMSARTDVALAAEHGAHALFTGAGGDQLFFEFPRWWPAADYLRCRGPDAGFASVAMASARLGRVSLWRAMASATRELVHPSAPWPEAQKQLPLIGPQAMALAGERDRFVHPSLHQVGQLPIGKATQTLALVHPVAYDDPFHPAAALEPVNPLLSQPLVELCLQLPTWVLTHGGRGRALARRAFATDLPPEIAGRRSKGGMEEHIKAVLLRNIDFARGLLLDGELVRQGLLDRTRVEEALSVQPSTLASHIGRLHVYIGIEAWLSRWAARPRAAG